MLYYEIFTAAFYVEKNVDIVLNLLFVIFRNILTCIEPLINHIYLYINRGCMQRIFTGYRWKGIGRERRSIGLIAFIVFANTCRPSPSPLYLPHQRHVRPCTISDVRTCVIVCLHVCGLLTIPNIIYVCRKPCYILTQFAYHYYYYDYCTVGTSFFAGCNRRDA